MLEVPTLGGHAGGGEGMEENGEGTVLKLEAGAPDWAPHWNHPGDSEMRSFVKYVSKYQNVPMIRNFCRILHHLRSSLLRVIGFYYMSLIKNHTVVGSSRW